MDRQQVDQINVIPLVDVMLVLLVIVLVGNTALKAATKGKVGI